ncbi:hypothetical protein DL95DRAFT_409859 [Leptodontidium sp. 2 PMI_412]|nr:hypothetical protein DL95DRAFT_409859 [Leptodontidium sp. 2 PMI_412]
MMMIFDHHGWVWSGPFGLAGWLVVLKGDLEQSSACFCSANGGGHSEEEEEEEMGQRKSRGTSNTEEDGRRMGGGAKAEEEAEKVEEEEKAKEEEEEAWEETMTQQPCPLTQFNVGDADEDEDADVDVGKGGGGECGGGDNSLQYSAVTMPPSTCGALLDLLYRAVDAPRRPLASASAFEVTWLLHLQREEMEGGSKQASIL